jgi:transposase
VTRIICGADVSAATLDARIGRDGPWRQFARTSEGIAQLAQFCKDHLVSLVVMEATGGYERLPFAQLWAADLPVAVVNPRSVRQFAEAMGTLEKTDKIDTAMIAWFAEVRHLEPTPLPRDNQQSFTALVVRMRQLVELRIVQDNQRRLVTDPAALASFTAVLSVLNKQLRALEVEVAALVEADPLWLALDAAFREIKGVADRTIARLIAHLPEIGTLSGKAVAKLSGLAPIARDSGKKTGKRPVRGGREAARSILYTVAELVRRHDPDFKAFYERLRAAGKPARVVRIALARKLLVRLNAKARDVRKTFAAANNASPA